MARRPVTWVMPRLGSMRTRRPSLPGIQVHIVIPILPPPNSVKNPSEVGLSSSSVILGMRLIHPSLAPLSCTMKATTGVRSSSTPNFSCSIRRRSRAT